MNMYHRRRPDGRPYVHQQSVDNEKPLVVPVGRATIVYGDLSAAIKAILDTAVADITALQAADILLHYHDGRIDGLDIGEPTPAMDALSIAIDGGTF